MKIAIVTFEGFNEIDSFVALNILNRVKVADWKAEIAAPTASITSMNGVTIQAHKPLEFANEADAVLIGSGRLTRQMIQDEALMATLKLDPTRQLIGSQCSGALVLQKLGLLQNRPVCTDGGTRPYLIEKGATVLAQPFFARDNVATAGGCLSATYLASWLILRSAGEKALTEALGYVAPVGEEESFISHVLDVINWDSSENKNAQLAIKL